MKTAKGLFLISRAHGLHSHMLDDTDFARLLHAQGLKEFSEMLQTTDYSSELSKIPSIELTSAPLERVFYERLSERWFSLLQMTSGKLRSILELYCRALEIENIKRIIRAVNGRNEITIDQLIPIPREYQTVNLHAMLLKKTMQELTQFLKESPFKRVEQRFAMFETYGDPRLLETALDNIYFDNLRIRTRRLTDSARLRQFIGTEADLKNLEIIIASKYMKVEQKEISDSILGMGFRLRKATISRLINTDIQEVQNISIWPSYSKLLHEVHELLASDKIGEMQNLFSAYLYSYARKARVRHPNSLVYVFSYMLLCLREAQNLAKLALGKQLAINEERLRRLLFL